MGYRTYFEIEVIAEGLSDKAIQNQYKKIAKIIGDDNILDEHGRTEEDIKWYSYEEDMRKHSSKNRDILFLLSGQGEESTDLWKAYFLNGKMQSCPAIITYDEFDESKLK